MMVLTMILHVFRVYLTGGFKKPRELTLVAGMVLAVIYYILWCKSLFRTLGSNWLLVSQNCNKHIRSYFYNKVALVELLCGSASVGQFTLTHFHSLHTFVLSLLTTISMLMHFLMICKQGNHGCLIKQ